MKGKGKGPPPPPKGIAKSSQSSRLTTAAPTAFIPVCEGVGTVRLKPTTTRVRQRDGTVFCEKRSDDGEMFERSVLEEAAATPQYVLDQEAGISRLEPKEFDSETSRWRPRAAQRGTASDGDNDWLLQRGTLRLVSYNVWFREHRQAERAKALFSIVEQEHADIICFQEVTPRFLGWLRDLAWVRELYLLSDSVGTTLRGAKLTYGVVMLMNRSLGVTSLTLHSLHTRMNRAALVACFPLGGLQLRVATAHLESLDNVAIRTNQLQSIYHLLVSEPNTENRLLLGKSLIPSDEYCGSILAGDMNFDDGNPEEVVVTQASFLDCWKACALDTTDPDVKADHYTMPFDDSIGLPTRIDRVFLGPRKAQSSCWYLVPKTMRRLGIESMDAHATADDASRQNVDPTSYEMIHQGDTDVEMPDLIPVESGTIAIAPNTISTPSDHYGLSCEFALATSGGCQS